jgi:guanylate kinase
VGFLIIVAGPSGVGKTTLCQQIPVDIPQIALSVSCTSRTKRAHEVEGKDYFFMTSAEFEAKIQKKEFIEWTQVHGNYYGIDRLSLEKQLKNGLSVLLNIDSVGAKTISGLFPENVRTIFIEPPSLSTLKERLIARGSESQTALQKRLDRGILELEQASWFEFRIVNEDFSAAYDQLKELIIRLLS